MLIYVFLEITNDGKPKYENRFIDIYNEAAQNGDYIIASEEYEGCITDVDKDVLTVIPAEIINSVDGMLEQKEDREKSLIYISNDELENFFDNCVKNKEKCMAIVSFAEYVFVRRVSVNNQLHLYIDTSVKKGNNMAELVVQQLDSSQIQLKKRNEEMEELRKEYNMKNEQIQQLQVRVHDLETELYRNEGKKKEKEQELDNMSDRLDKTEEIKMTYLELYKALLAELDKVKTELLEQKAKH